jgi:hypothetical protein
MTDDARLTTDLWVSAHLRLGNSQGVPMMVVHKGDRTSGTVLLKINRLDGYCRVLTQVRHLGRLAWAVGTGAGHVSEADADQYVARQLRMDPDLWVIEIEDRQDRHWFEGAVLGSPDVLLAKGRWPAVDPGAS